MCLCIHRNGVIAARRQSSSIRATNIKIGGKLPRYRVKDNTHFGGPAARARKNYYNICFCLRILCNHYGSVWIYFWVVHKLNLVWATFWPIKHISGAPQHLEIFIQKLSVKFYHCFSRSMSACTLTVSIFRVNSVLNLYVEIFLMIKQTPCTARSFANTHFYTLKLFHSPQFSFSEVIIFNKIFHPSNQIHKKLTSLLFASQLKLSKASNKHLS